MNKNEEILDLVNEQDEIIGQVLKVKANQDPSLWHREIAILLFDNQGRLLLQKRSKNKIVRPGKWSVACAGHVPQGMAVEEAAHMELREELGIDTKLLFIEKSLFTAENETHFTNWFIGKYADEEIVLEEDEVEQVKWEDEKEFQKTINSGTLYGEPLTTYASRFWNGEFDYLAKQL